MSPRALILLLLLFLAPPAPAATWYHDNAATGANNGTSWADAWSTNLGMASIAAGDTVYASGGSAGSVKEYTNAIVFTKSGTPASPITFRVSQESGHNGKAWFPGITIGTSTNIVVNGARDSGFVVPTSVHDIDTITNNIGLKFGRTNATANTAAMFISGAGGGGGKIQWCEVTQGTTNNTADQQGIQFLNLTVLTNWLTEYCWIHHVQNDGINMNSVTLNPDYWDALTVRWCIIEQTGDDGIQSVRNGLTLEHSFLRDHWIGLYNGHPDQLQLSGLSRGYIKIVNNIFRNKANSLIIGEFQVDEGTVLGPMIVGGNLFYNTRNGYYYTNNTQAYGVTLDAWRVNRDGLAPTATNVLMAKWDGLQIVNNTTYLQLSVPFKVGKIDADIDGSTYPGTTESKSALAFWFTNSNFRNNLFVDNALGSARALIVQGTGTNDGAGGIQDVYYRTNDWEFTHNVIAGLTAASRTFVYNGRTNTGGNVFGFGCSSNTPTGFETNTYTLALGASDTIAKDAGYSLTSLTSIYPRLAFDLAGNYRGADGQWDIGAQEFTTPYGPQDNVTDNLLLWWQFTNNFVADGFVVDSSTNGANGYSYGYASDQTNFPTAMTFTNLLTGLTNYAAHFTFWSNGWSLYGLAPQYIALTNHNTKGLQNLRYATISFWAYNDKVTDIPGLVGLSGLGWEDNQGRFITGGYAYPGAWSIGRFSDQGAPYIYLRIYTNAHAGSDQYLWFGEGSRNATSGSTNGYKPWSHYVVTWSNGTAHAYYNGINTDSHTFTGPDGNVITNLTIRGPSGSTDIGFLMVGGDNHNGLPWLEPNDDSGEQYPNHGPFSGGMADLRISRTNWTALQVAAVHWGTNYLGEGGEEGGGEPNEPAVFIFRGLRGMLRSVH